MKYLLLTLLLPLQVVAGTIADPLDSYIEKLAIYECRDCPVNFSKVDVDGERVYGTFQFKESTFREQVNKFNLLPYAEESEVMNMIYDTEFQRKLVKLMIQENPKLIHRWDTSVKRGLGLPPNYVK